MSCSLPGPWCGRARRVVHARRRAETAVRADHAAHPIQHSRAQPGYPAHPTMDPPSTPRWCHLALLYQGRIVLNDLALDACAGRAAGCAAWLTAVRGVPRGLAGRPGAARRGADGGAGGIRRRHRGRPPRPHGALRGAGRRRGRDVAGTTAHLRPRRLLLETRTARAGGRDAGPALRRPDGAGDRRRPHRHEHVDAGLPFPPVDERWRHTAEVLAEVRRRSPRRRTFPQLCSSRCR